jgi:hypothetical protein
MGRCDRLPEAWIAAPNGSLYPRMLADILLSQTRLRQGIGL